MTIKIRPIQKRDNVQIAVMIREVFEEFGAAKEGTVYSDPTTDHLFELFQEEDAVLYVAEKNGEIHGCCGVYPTKGLPNNCAELVKFYLSSEIRGKGYGRQLYQKCESVAIKMNNKQLYIESMDDFSRAVKMYKKLGFIRLDKALGNSGHFGCKIWMLKELNTTNS